MKTTKKAQRAAKRTDQLVARINAHFGADAERVIESTVLERAQIDGVFAMLPDDDQHAIIVRQIARVHGLKKPTAPTSGAQRVEALEADLTAHLHRKKYLVIRIAPHTFAALRSEGGMTTTRIIALSTSSPQQVAFLRMLRYDKRIDFVFVANIADIEALSL